VPYLLGTLGVLLLVYAAGLLWTVRRGRRLPPAAYLGLVGLNGLLVAGLLAWAVANR
jgi:hypothetical protein